MWIIGVHLKMWFKCKWCFGCMLCRSDVMAVEFQARRYKIQWTKRVCKGFFDNFWNAVQILKKKKLLQTWILWKVLIMNTGILVKKSNQNFLSGHVFWLKYFQIRYVELKFPTFESLPSLQFKKYYFFLNTFNIR